MSKQPQQREISDQRTDPRSIVQPEVRRLRHTMWRRLKVVGIGIILAAVFALSAFRGPMMPYDMSLRDRTDIWAAIMGGPVTGTVWNLASSHLAISFGWLGLLLVPAHPIRPNWVTGLITTVGLILWFFAGFYSVMVSVWGA